VTAERPPDHVLAAFGLSGVRPAPLGSSWEGGWRCGEVVLSLVADHARAAWSAKVRETLFVDGPVQVTRTDGYRLVTGDMLVDIPARSMVGRGRVEGVHPLGRFEGDELKVDLGSRVVTLDGNTKMRINP